MKKIIISILFLVSILLFTSFNAYSEWELKTHPTYFGTTDIPVNIRWIASENYYQVFIWFTYSLDRSNNVEYEIYNDTVLLDTIIVDQSDETIANDWHQIGWYFPCISGKLKVKVKPTNNDGTVCADAIKVSSNICNDEGIIVDNDSGISIGTWTTSTINTAYNTNSLVTSSSNSEFTWEIDNLIPSTSAYKYEYYILHKRYNRKYLESSSNNHQVFFTLPRTGHYVFYIRSVMILNTEEIELINTSSRSELIDYIDSHGFEVSNPELLSDTELKQAMIDSGMKSDWSTSEMNDRGLVDCQETGWWVYGYPAPVGPIIIN